MSGKRATVFMEEMTNPEVEAFLQTHHTVIVPVGATEQHGPHAPLGTDTLIPREIARRIAAEVGALVGPSLPFTLSYPHIGFKGLVNLRIPTFMAVVEDLCVSFARAGFKRVVFLNGHYDNTYAIAYACANAAERLPRDVRAFPLNYWDGMAPEVRERYNSLEKGMHANGAETSAVLAIDPGLVDMAHANREFPPFPEFEVPSGAVHTAFFFSSPGSVHAATRSGTWGDATTANRELGEEYLGICAAATVKALRNVEANFEAMPLR
jgi:creatinine amidohydrolase